jgi:transposase
VIITVISNPTKKEVVMYYAGIDAHSKSSTICVVDKQGKKLGGGTVVTSAEGLRCGLSRWLGQGVVAAVESSGITPWVCDLLKQLKVTKVVVVNPNRVRLIAESRKKNDRVDAATLAELLRLGALPEVHLPTPAARQQRAELQVRRRLIRQRTALGNQVRALLRGWGMQLPARYLARRDGWPTIIERAQVPEYVRTILRTLRAVYNQLSQAIQELERWVCQAAKQDEAAQRLQTIPSVGPISALTLVAAVDGVKRFTSAKQLTSYCGIVPTVRASAERQEQGPITREGRSEVRAVWIQAAHSLARSRNPEARPLQRWFARVARRRGFRTAIVALARRMLSLAFYLLRDGTRYEPLRFRSAHA